MTSDESKWHLFDLLDPIQLGFVYESLKNNASDSGLNSQNAKDYLAWAEEVKDAIEGNCGFNDYVQHQQALCRKLADYDGRHGFRG